MLSAKQGSHWYHFYNVFGMTRPGSDVSDAWFVREEKPVLAL